MGRVGNTLRRMRGWWRVHLLRSRAAQLRTGITAADRLACEHASQAAALRFELQALEQRLAYLRRLQANEPWMQWGL